MGFDGKTQRAAVFRWVFIPLRQTVALVNVTAVHAASVQAGVLDGFESNLKR
jgi:hypothetical protein